MYEKDLLGEQICRIFRKEIKFDYMKIINVNNVK